MSPGSKGQPTISESAIDFNGKEKLSKNLERFPEIIAEERSHDSCKASKLSAEQ